MLEDEPNSIFAQFTTLPKSQQEHKVSANHKKKEGTLKSFL